MMSPIKKMSSSAILPALGTPEGLNLQVYILTPKVASR